MQRDFLSAAQRRRIVIVWELGHGSSYLLFIALLADCARQAGHDCTVIAPDIEQARRFIPRNDVTVLQSPVAPIPSEPALATQTSYASLLFNNGYRNFALLSRHIADWVIQLRQARPDVVLARHSPTAILACRVLGTPVVHYGNGFSIPPLVSPWPSFRPDLCVSEKTLTDNDRAITEIMNSALAQLRTKPISSGQDMFRVSRTVMLDYPVLDPWHGLRSHDLADIPYVGFPELSYGPAPVWPRIRNKKIFLSLLPGSDMSWLYALTGLGAEVLLRVRDDNTSPSLAPSIAHVRVAPRGQVNFREAIQDCDVVVGYGSHNLVCEALLAGKPIGVIPHSADELTLGLCVARLGAGVQLSQSPSEEGIRALRWMIQRSEATRAAEEFSAKHSFPRKSIPAQLLAFALASSVKQPSPP